MHHSKVVSNSCLTVTVGYGNKMDTLLSPTVQYTVAITFWILLYTDMLSEQHVVYIMYWNSV